MCSVSSAGGLVFCKCGKRAALMVSWTPDKPGRRFHDCRNWKAMSTISIHRFFSNGCNYFVWEDPPMCPRTMTIIPDLKWKLAVLEVYKKETKKENRNLKLMLAGSGLTFILFCLGYWIFS
ncbi:uncharacterized protein [Henckelia pumila]|uniref:uncharacterized protein n=1 Tax=Henckelia pumila TaxID=405737 RepID=UPI003C6E981C